MAILLWWDRWRKVPETQALSFNDLINSCSVDLFRSMLKSNHCLHELLSCYAQRSDSLCSRGYHYVLLACISNWHKQSFIVRSFFSAGTVYLTDLAPTSTSEERQYPVNDWWWDIVTNKFRHKYTARSAVSNAFVKSIIKQRVKLFSSSILLA